MQVPPLCKAVWQGRGGTVKSLIAILALALLVLPMLAGIRRLRDLSRRSRERDR